uniref:Uncharacterized protein n=1 Tax=viral metagenome TaxID=1070528 RepID=A0A6C0ADR3_9ZZZZ
MCLKNKNTNFYIFNNNHEWLDKNWDKIYNFFDNDKNFKDFIECNFLKTPNLLILDVLFKHNFSFLQTKLIECNFLSLKDINFEVFKWIIDNKIILKDDIKYKDLSRNILFQGNDISFEKFKYAFNSGFPLSVDYSFSCYLVYSFPFILRYL